MGTWMATFWAPAWALSQEALRDSMILWLETDNRSAWIRACGEEEATEWILEDWGLTCCAAPDERTWAWMRLGVHPLRAQSPALDGIAPSPEAFVNRDVANRSRIWRGWALMLGVMGTCFGFLMVREQRMLRRAVRGLSDGPGRASLRLWLVGSPRNHRLPDEAWEALFPMEKTSIASLRWRMLSPSEQECARLLEQGIKVQAVAASLACSVSYVYNVRSSIRKKWGLAEEEDVVDAIRKELSFDEN